MCSRIYVIYISVDLVNAFVSVSIWILYRNDDKYSADTVREYIFRTRILFNPVYLRNPYSSLISRIASGSAFTRNFLVFKTHRFAIPRTIPEVVPC